MKSPSQGCFVVMIAALMTSGVGAQPPEQDRGERDAAAPNSVAHPIVTALDTDGDGELSAEEIANAAVELKKLDKNGDGRLSRDELRTPSASSAANDSSFVQRFFNRFDGNKDKKITQDELPQQFQPLLKRGDKNQDGALDETEFHELTKTLGTESSGTRQTPADAKK